MNETNYTKALQKAYNKRLKQLNKTFFSDKSVGLTLFVEYLRYIRDINALMNYDSPEKQFSFAALVAAITEFEAYRLCRNTNNKVFHWNNFIELVKHNMEDWLEIDDSV